MTDPIIDRLDEIRDRADAATPGPWDFQPWSTFALPSGEYDESILLANASPDGEMARGLLDEDGEFIAAARTDVSRMDAALRAVLDLHKPTTMDFIVGDCAAEACEHDDPDDCSTAPRKVCGGCVDQAEHVTPYAMESVSVVQLVIWPCDHVQAIAGALGVETEGENDE